MSSMSSSVLNKKSMSLNLNFDQGPSSRKQIYNQSILDILTPSYKESSLNTPDVNKCVVNSPETERVIRDFNLQSSYLYPGLLSPSLFQFSLPHFSPNLHSPKLHTPNVHSPRLSKLIDEFIDPNLNSTLDRNSPNNENATSIVEMDVDSENKSKIDQSVNQLTKPIDAPIDAPIQVSPVNSIQPTTEHQSINSANSITNNQTNHIQSNNRILCLPRINPDQFNNFNVNHPIRSGYFFNQNGYTINNQVNYIYNNQVNLSNPLNRPPSQQMIGFNSTKNVDKSRNSTSSVNSNDSQSNSSVPKNEADDPVKVEDKKAKNRAAASRCRKRKQDRVNFLEEQVKLLSADNIRLSRSERLLYDENNRLKQHLNLHLSSGCNLIGLSTYSMISK